MSKEMNVNLYFVNKQGMAQVTPYSFALLNKKCKEVAEDLWDRFPKNKNNYWMLLCRERNDYTVFCLENDEKEFALALVECLQNRGKTLDITRQKDDNYEIWIRDYNTDENVVYYLFNYNEGVIKV